MGVLNSLKAGREKAKAQAARLKEAEAAHDLAAKLLNLEMKGRKGISDSLRAVGERDGYGISVSRDPLIVRGETQIGVHSTNFNIGMPVQDDEIVHVVGRHTVVRNRPNIAGVVPIDDDDLKDVALLETKARKYDKGPEDNDPELFARLLKADVKAALIELCSFGVIYSISIWPGRAVVATGPPDIVDAGTVVTLTNLTFELAKAVDEAVGESKRSGQPTQL